MRKEKLKLVLIQNEEKFLEKTFPFQLFPLEAPEEVFGKTFLW